MIEISCGFYHSACVSDEGKVYCWGEGEGGKLGLAGETENTLEPTQVKNSCDIGSTRSASARRRGGDRF